MIVERGEKFSVNEVLVQICKRTSMTLGSRFNNRELGVEDLLIRYVNIFFHIMPERK